MQEPVEAEGRGEGGGGSHVEVREDGGRGGMKDDED